MKKRWLKAVSFVCLAEPMYAAMDFLEQENPYLSSFLGGGSVSSAPSLFSGKMVFFSKEASSLPKNNILIKEEDWKKEVLLSSKIVLEILEPYINSFTSSNPTPHYRIEKKWQEREEPVFFSYRAYLWQLLHGLKDNFWSDLLSLIMQEQNSTNPQQQGVPSSSLMLNPSSTSSGNPSGSKEGSPSQISNNPPVSQPIIEEVRLPQETTAPSPLLNGQSSQEATGKAVLTSSVKTQENETEIVPEDKKIPNKFHSKAEIVLTKHWGLSGGSVRVHNYRVVNKLDWTSPTASNNDFRNNISREKPLTRNKVRGFTKSLKKVNQLRTDMGEFFSRNNLDMCLLASQANNIKSLKLYRVFGPINESKVGRVTTLIWKFFKNQRKLDLDVGLNSLSLDQQPDCNPESLRVWGWEEIDGEQKTFTIRTASQSIGSRESHRLDTVLKNFRLENPQSLNFYFNFANLKNEEKVFKNIWNRFSSYSSLSSLGLTFVYISENSDTISGSETDNAFNLGGEKTEKVDPFVKALVSSLSSVPNLSSLSLDLSGVQLSTSELIRLTSALSKLESLIKFRTVVAPEEAGNQIRRFLKALPASLLQCSIKFVGDSEGNYNYEGDLDGNYWRKLKSLICLSLDLSHLTLPFDRVKELANVLSKLKKLKDLSISLSVAEMDNEVGSFPRFLPITLEKLQLRIKVEEKLRTSNIGGLQNLVDSLKWLKNLSDLSFLFSGTLHTGKIIYFKQKSIKLLEDWIPTLVTILAILEEDNKQGSKDLVLEEDNKPDNENSVGVITMQKD